MATNKFLKSILFASTIAVSVFGFSVQNFDSRVKQLTSNGVVFQGKVVTDSKTLNRMVIVLDPDGNRIQLFEDK